MAREFQDIPQFPVGVTWEDWNGNMLHYFGEEPLPMVNEEDWKLFALTMSSLTTFSVYGLPDPDEVKSWREWANLVITAVNGPSS
jgi:hypothetical protein